MIGNLMIINLIYPLCGVVSSDGKDKYNIPIQQLARAYNDHPESFSVSDKELLFTAIQEGDLYKYCPVCADPVKARVDIQAVYGAMGRFIKLWIDIGKREPMEYLDAFLMTDYYGWYPGGIIDGYNRIGKAKYDYAITETSYFAMEVEEPGVLSSKWPELYDKYYRLSRYITFQRLPVISQLFSVGAMFWLLLYVMCWLLVERRVERYAPLIYALMICVAAFFGPMILVRYQLILFYLTVYFVASLSDTGDNSRRLMGHEGLRV